MGMLAATVHCCAQVNVAIMLAPVAFLGHITSQPVEAMARMETDKVSLHNSLLPSSVPTALVLNAGFNCSRIAAAAAAAELQQNCSSRIEGRLREIHVLNIMHAHKAAICNQQPSETGHQQVLTGSMWPCRELLIY